MATRDRSLLCFPTSINWAYYIDDILFASEDLCLPQDTAGFAETSVREKMSGEPTKNLRPSQCCESLRVICLGETLIVPEAVFDKMQAYRTLKNVKEVQAFAGILRIYRNFTPPQHIAFIP